ncbi:MAG: preprotein translocase subunit SecG [Planctomycetales bacterium]|nr:preprotein translocase subunit SecG [Planctomycetales bacterium]
MSLHAVADLPAHAMLLASFGHYFYGITMSLVAIFLILLVLIQRGRGGGLAGAFGGMGGQSAFGTKAGDTFTRITIGVALFWIVLSIGAVKFLGESTGSFGEATPLTDTQVIPTPTSDGANSPILPPVDNSAGSTDTTESGSNATGSSAEVDGPAALAPAADGAAPASDGATTE